MIREISVIRLVDLIGLLAGAWPGGSRRDEPSSAKSGHYQGADCFPQCYSPDRKGEHPRAFLRDLGSGRGTESCNSTLVIGILRVTQAA